MTSGRPADQVTPVQDGLLWVGIHFLSDWHMGTGTGRHGAIDRRVLRDGEEFPMVGAKAAVGVLRDAAETVAAGLDGGDSGTWHAWVTRVFGSQPGVRSPGAGQQVAGPPVPAALHPRPLRIPERLREEIRRSPSPETLTDALVVLRPGVKIDPETRTAAKDFFRIEERARAGLVVTSRWRLHWDSEPASVPWEAEFLIRAAASLVEAMGGKRRRGVGRCVMLIGASEEEVLDPTGKQAAEWLARGLRQLDEAKEPPAPPRDTAVAGLPQSAREDPLFLRHELQITALTPVVVARAVIGNLVRATPTIPGSLLLPVVAKALGPGATELITSGALVVTNATPEIAGGRSLPVPLAMQRDKDDEDGAVVNRFHRECSRKDRLKPCRGFCVWDGKTAILGSPDLIERAHAVVDDARQRPTEDTGGLYVYEAIPAGTTLRAELWLTEAATLAPERLRGEHAVGRSRKDDYGQVAIEVLGPGDDRPALHCTMSEGEELVVWLTSDLLLRGPAGEPAASVEALGAALSERLGTTLTLARPEGDDDQRPAALIGSSRFESWQRRWSLPRPSLAGLAAGGAVRFVVGDQIATEALDEIESRGLGERTAEGYGRVLFQPDLLKSVTIDCGRTARADRRRGTQRPEPSLERTPNDPSPLYRMIHRHAWRDRLRRDVLAWCLDQERRGSVVPSGVPAAQAGTLRTLAWGLLRDGEGGAESVLSWVDRTRKNRDRRRHWPERRLKRIETLVGAEQADEIWKILGIDEAERAHLGDLRWEAVGTLLDEAARMTVVGRSANGGKR